MPVRIGTSGWSYDDWEGHVFPRSLDASDRLRFYARRFATVEIDSTYYRDPAPQVVKGWTQKTRDARGFEFSVKVHKTLTHEALVDGDVAEVRRIAQAWRALVADPLAQAQRLGAILLQLSPAVLRKGSSLDRLDAALDALAPHRCAVEFRNRTWHDERPGYDPDTLAILDAHNAAAVIVDGPPFPPIVAGGADHAFVRFHGRNAERWNKPERYYGDRYDYLYSDEELDPWAERLAALAKEKRDVRVYFNNHVQGKAFRNGETMEAMLEAREAPVAKADSPQQRLF
ncbi:MAG TPA: DUF72 domain-containing protein [Candidatus Thermoplasmatota archaeon]|nr:DUF72 domain-containing protein [Candidatus Thermoplasmatota archaeon]